jgi:hypothetical protein
LISFTTLPEKTLGKDLDFFGCLVVLGVFDDYDARQAVCWICLAHPL